MAFGGQKHLALIRPPVVVVKEEISVSQTDREAIEEIKHKVERIDTKLNFGKWAASVVIGAGATWLAWLTNLLITKL